MNSRNKPSSASRFSIEAVLKNAEGPLSAREIAEQANVPLSVTKTHLAHGINRGQVHNLNPKSRNNARYVWGSGKVAPTAVTPRHVPTGPYEAERGAVRRPGSEQAFELPSVENGERVKRKRPLILGVRR